MLSEGGGVGCSVGVLGVVGCGKECVECGMGCGVGYDDVEWGVGCGSEVLGLTRESTA